MHPDTAAAYRRLDDAAARALSADAPRNTDDNMRIEYRAPRNLHRGTTLDNNARLDRFQTDPWPLVAGDPDALAEIAYDYARREEEDLAIDTLVDAALRVEADDLRRRAWLEQAFGWWLGDTAVDGDRERLRLEQQFVRRRVLSRRQGSAEAEVAGPAGASTGR